MKSKKGILMGNYFKDMKSATNYYQGLSKVQQKQKSIVRFIGGECLIVGNHQIAAVKL